MSTTDEARPGLAHAENDPPASSRRQQLRFGVAVALSVLAGSALGLLVIPRAPEPREVTAAPQTVKVLGATLPLEDQVADKALDRAHDYLSRTFTLLLPDRPSVALTLAKWGVRADDQRLVALVDDARDPSSPLRRFWSQELDEPAEARPKARELSLPAPLTLDWDVSSSELFRIKDHFDHSPENARLDLETQRILTETIGQWLDVDATLAAMAKAIQRGEMKVQAVVTEQPPARQKNQLVGLKFDSVLGHFETTYDRSQKYEDRTYNLRLAAKKLDGTVLLPGETFDFNEVVGPRDEANGYRVATVIADGELVDGIGGGTCQISGTLHGAAFFAGLEIVERYPHTRPSSYIKMGMDATVVYPTINFRFKNPFDFPIAVHQVVENGKVRAEILGPRFDQVVTMIRKVDAAIPYEQIERKDPHLPLGQRILAQRGIPGFRLHRYRTVRRGSHTHREKWRDIYPPTPQVIRVGVGDAKLEKKKGVSTPEYRADELLILTLTRSSDGSPGEFAENREPGKFGNEGWTQVAGMPLWQD